MEAYRSGSFISHVLTSETKCSWVSKATILCWPGVVNYYQCSFQHPHYLCCGLERKLTVFSVFSPFLDSEYEQHHLVPFGQFAERRSERSERGRRSQVPGALTSRESQYCQPSPHPTHEATGMASALFPLMGHFDASLCGNGGRCLLAIGLLCCWRCRLGKGRMQRQEPSRSRFPQGDTSRDRQWDLVS